MLVGKRIMSQAIIFIEVFSPSFYHNAGLMRLAEANTKCEHGIMSIPDGWLARPRRHKRQQSQYILSLHASWRDGAHLVHVLASNRLYIRCSEIGTHVVHYLHTYTEGLAEPGEHRNSVRDMHNFIVLFQVFVAGGTLFCGAIARN